jgi:Uma2 family endonuclease
MAVERVVLTYKDYLAMPDDGRICGAPTLAIEVLSPSTATGDRGPKFQLYARYGVPYYWIADTDARVLEGFELATDAYRLVDRRQGGGPDGAAAIPRSGPRSRRAVQRLSGAVS